MTRFINYTFGYLGISLSALLFIEKEACIDAKRIPPQQEKAIIFAGIVMQKGISRETENVILGTQLRAIKKFRGKKGPVNVRKKVQLAGISYLLFKDANYLNSVGITYRRWAKRIMHHYNYTN